MVFLECYENYYAGSVFARQTKKTVKYCRLVAKLNSFGANRNEMRRYSIPNGVDPFLSTIQMILMQKILLSFDDCGRTMVTCVSVHLRYRSIYRWKSKNQWFLCNWSDFLKTQRLAIFLYDHRKVLWKEILVAMTWGTLQLWKYGTFVERAHKTETNHGPKLSELDIYP